MISIENILSKYRSKYIVPFTLLLSAIIVLNFYFIFEITPQPNDECIWEPQRVTKDSVGFFFVDVKFEGVTWQAGIRDGDQLIAIQDVNITYLPEANVILNEMASGDSAKYTIYRDGQLIETKVEVKKLIQFGGLAFVILAGIWLLVGFIVIKAKPSGRSQTIFYRIAIALTLFSMFNILIIQNIENPIYAYPWIPTLVDQLWSIGAVFIPFLIIHFFLIFPNTFKITERKWTQIILYGLPLMIYIGITVFKIIYIYTGEINPFWFYAVLSNVYLYGIMGGAVIGFISLFINYVRLTNKKDRDAIFVILVSYAIGIGAAIFSIILIGSGNPAMKYNQPEYFMPIILIAVLPISFGYSIFKYSLMDVSDVIKTTILYGFATITVAAVYFFVIYLFGQSISSAIGTQYQVMIAGIIFIVFAIVFQSTKDKFQELLTKKFYPEQFAYQKVLLKFSNDVATTVGLENILKSTCSTLVDSLNLAVFGIALKDIENNKYELKESIGFKDPSLKFYCDDDKLKELIELRNKTKQFTAIEENEFNTVCPEETELLLAEGVYTIIPLVIKSKIIGLLLFGLKYSGSKFAGKDLELLTAAANQTAVALENARLYDSERQKLKTDRDLENARKIQMGLLPKCIPDMKGMDICGTMIPAMQVGGDYYDLIPISDSKIFVIVGDVSGKGLSASFYMSKLQTMMQLYCTEGKSPKNVLVEVNKQIFNSLEKNWFITCTIALFDTQKQTVKIARAGHTSIAVVSDGLINEYSPNGIGIGLEEGSIFEKNLEEIELPVKRDSLYAIYSDGVTEAMNEKKELFGQEKFNDLLIELSKYDSSIIEKEIMASINEFRGAAEQNDDITLVLLKIT